MLLRKCISFLPENTLGFLAFDCSKKQSNIFILSIDKKNKNKYVYIIQEDHKWTSKQKHFQSIHCLCVKFSKKLLLSCSLWEAIFTTLTRLKIMSYHLAALAIDRSSSCESCIDYREGPSPNTNMLLLSRKDISCHVSPALKLLFSLHHFQPLVHQ